MSALSLIRVVRVIRVIRVIRVMRVIRVRVSKTASCLHGNPCCCNLYLPELYLRMPLLYCAYTHEPHASITDPFKSIEILILLSHMHTWTHRPCRLSSYCGLVCPAGPDPNLPTNLPSLQN
jgi:hypothetical protein